MPNYKHFKQHKPTVEEANKFEAENKKLKVENYDNNQYIFTLKEEIKKLKAENEQLHNTILPNIIITNDLVRLGKIEVLSELKEKAISLSAIETYHVCNLVDEIIERLKKC